MSIFSRENKTQPKDIPTTSVQTSTANTHPFSYLNGYTPLATNGYRMYKSMVESVPIINSAIWKIIHLIGGFELVTNDKNIDVAMKEFFETINVGGNQQGLQCFLDNYLAQLLTYGTAIGELVMDENGLYGLYNGELEAVEVKRANNNFDLVFSPNGVGSTAPFEHQERLLFSVLNPEAGKILGTSILEGLPFVTDILLKIYNTIGVNWQRLGNLRYAVTYKPQADSMDKAFAKERATQMATAWKEAMSSKDVKDFVAVGDVKVSVIGADNQILDSEIPVRQMLEQIIAKTGLMPYMFGLNWSSTERMSKQQADILTTELEAYRRAITPVIKRIAQAYLSTMGIYKNVQVKWEDITLQDQIETAKARLYNAQAEKAQKEVNQ